MKTLGELGGGAVVRQAALLALLCLVLFLVVRNAAVSGLSFDFGFLAEPARYPIETAFLDYDEDRSHGRAAVVGFANTLVVAVAAILSATLLGGVLGLLRCSGLWAFDGLVLAYVWVFRRVPVLLQILFWYAALIALLPGSSWVAVDRSALASPEFLGLWLALTFHAAASISDIVYRGTVYERDHRSAAGDPSGRDSRVASLNRALARLVDQYVEVTKNTSLGLAIGYSGLFETIGGKSVNTSGHVIECLLIVLALYLLMTLPLVALRGVFRRRARLDESNPLRLLPGDAAPRPASPSLRTDRRLVGLKVNVTVAFFAVVALLVAALPAFDWAVSEAVLHASDQVNCRQQGSGACWAVIGENLDKLVYGFYPESDRWRVQLALGLVLVGLALPLVGARRYRATAWLAVPMTLAIAVPLLWGGLGLAPVATSSFGGLLLVVGVGILAVPGGIVMGGVFALLRRSPLPLLRLCVCGVVLLFESTPILLFVMLASLVALHLLPLDPFFSHVARLAGVLALCGGATIAGLLRLESGEGPTSRAEAARPIDIVRAMAGSLGPIAEVCRETVKNCSLLVLVSLPTPMFMSMAIMTESSWVGVKAELYLAAAVVYLFLCAAIDGYAALLSRRLGTAGNSTKAAP